MSILFPLLVALIGLLIYLLSKDGKRTEVGRITYFAGLLAFLLQAAPHIVNFFGMK